MITDIKVLDNFYTDPEYITKLCDGNFPISGCGTGNRSIDLSKINQEVYAGVKNALCSIHGVDPLRVKMNTFFMVHEYNSVDDIFNVSSTHMDGKNPDVCRSTVDEYRLAFCGQILLTKDPDPESGVTIHRMKPNEWDAQEIVKRCIDEYTIPGEMYRAGKITLDEMKELRRQHEENFELTCEVKNVYNRMVSWKGGTLHGQRITKTVPKKLNQYFFAEWY